MKNKNIFSVGKNLGTTNDIPNIIKNLPPVSRIIFGILFLITLISALILIAKISDNFLVEVPRKGGSFTEGVIGKPRFVNPVLAESETDKDLIQLIYSGLMRKTPNGDVVEDLAQSVVVSDDSTTYTVKLKDNIFWHDGEPITADDVVFTIQKIKDPLIKSPLQASWDGVEIEKIDQKTISFKLSVPYSLFIDNFTVGIIPKHIWQNFPPLSDFDNNIFNTEPVGSGPYKIEEIKRDKTGLVKEYSLSSFSKFALGEPFINTIDFKFFNNEEDAIKEYIKGNIDSIGGVSPIKIKENNLQDEKNLRLFPLTRIFAVFLNQNKQEIFIDNTVRQALFYGVDRNNIINEILLGYGIPATSPLPKGSIGYEEDGTLKTKSDAKKLLVDDGWELNKDGIYEKDGKLLSFTLSTANTEELERLAKLLKKEWKEIGVDVKLKFFEMGDLNQEVIRPREYEALLFGEVVGVNPDPFAFWHSSQRLDPGINIALYANITTDKLLEEARTTQDKDLRIKKYKEFTKEIKKDFPTIFLYSPYYIYLTPKQIKNIKEFPITIGSDRFININELYIKTDRIWKLFL